MRVFIVLSLLLLPSFSWAQQHTPIPKGRQCFALLGEQKAAPGAAQMTPSPSNDRGSVLMTFEANGTVRLHFLRSGEPYANMSQGKAFADVARTMRDQGSRPVTPAPDGTLKFDNGQPAAAQDYQVAIDPSGNASGKAVSPNGQFSLRGTCRSIG